MTRPPAVPPRDATSVDSRLLDQLLAQPASERAGWLRQQAKVAPDAVARLAPLVAEIEAGDDFLPAAGALRGPLFDALRGDLAQAAEQALLAPGDRLGSYVVAGRVGRGGMGEVYRARDEQLGRDVALKVLPAGGADEDRLARLRREARLLAALNHPNIGAIYGLVSDGARSALVLEFVQGPTLADRLADGPLPIVEVLSVARQLADALDAARARRIVHCDLKPANIAFARDGRVKVLDFGIATVWRSDPAAASASGSLFLATLDAPGTVIGTAAYMSPEQVRGDTVGHRTDIWAFGCVLFEMLTGARAFDGHTTADVLARVLEHPPQLDRLPPSTPPSLRRLVERCLEKDVSRRLGAIADACPLIDASEREAAAPPGAPEGATRAPKTWPAWRLLLGAILGLAVLAGLAWVSAGREPAAVSRLTVPLPPTDELVTGAQPAVAVTPDGRTIVYRARRQGEVLLFRRHLDDSAPTPLAGTANAVGPFLSPDGRWIGFHQDGLLMKVPMAGGTPSRIADVGGGGSSSSWGDGDEVVVAATPGRGLLRVPAGGGTPVLVTQTDPQQGDLSHDFPEVLPGGRTAIFTRVQREGSHIAAVDLATGAISTITEGRQARFVPGGHLLVVRGDALWAAPFDASRAMLTGDLRQVMRGLDTNATAQFAVTRTGTLVYVPPRDLVPPRSLVWFDRQGREQPAPLERRRYVRSSLSPDGTKVALVMVDEVGEDLWVQDLGRGALTRLTRDPQVDTAPVWSPDGRTIVFRSDREGGGLFRVPADGGTPPQRLTPADGRLLTPYAFTPDGQALLFTEFRSYRDQDIGLLSLDDDGTVTMILSEPFTELRPALSPDGRWLAYQADASGRFEVYVRRWPDVHSRRWQVSTRGGMSPQWSPDGGELLYYDGQSMVSVKVEAGDQPFWRAPERLFDAAPFAGRLGPVYSVSPDGRRFLLIREEPERDSVAARRHLLLVQNWTTELAGALAGAR